MLEPEKIIDNLHNVTYEQLYDCATFLALSILHHRITFGEVPLIYSVNELSAAKNGSDAIEALTEVGHILTEAFTLIKTESALLSNKLSGEKAPRIIQQEKRHQIRIDVTAPIFITTADSAGAITANLVNISWGGAAFNTEHSVGKVGDILDIELPSFKGRQISVQAEILRCNEEAGIRKYGVRFSRLRTDDEAVLEQLLTFLASSGNDSGKREHTRLTQRIDIQYDDTSELHATLYDISAGGMGITVPEPMELNESLQVSISTTDDRCQLVLRARVVRQQVLDASNMRMYRVGLEFEHPSDDIKHRVSEIIHNLASVNISS
jgi:c-di-GMP-binding flagellar brake protein YcgR